LTRVATTPQGGGEAAFSPPGDLQPGAAANRQIACFWSKKRYPDARVTAQVTVGTSDKRSGKQLQLGEYYD